MVFGEMLPVGSCDRAPADAFASDGTALSECQSPFERWLCEPTEQAKTRPHFWMQEQAPAAPTQVVQCPQQAILPPVAAVQPVQCQQPTWAYVLTVGAAPPAATTPPAPLWPSPLNVYRHARDDCAVDDGVHSCSTDASHDAASAMDSDDSASRAHCAEAQQPSASQSRRRRRQRAVAVARAEHFPQHFPQTVLPAGPRRREAIDLSAAAYLGAPVCARLTEQIKAGGEAMHAALECLIRSARRFCFDSQGCRVLQLAIESGSHAGVVLLVKELQGCVARAAASPHGNFVLQKIVEVMPASSSRFISQELLGHAVESACNKFGCRILCRLLEHSATDASTVQLVEELLAKPGYLIRHDFGHHVIESILEHGLDRHKQAIMAGLESELCQNVFNRSALFVLDRALHHCATTAEGRRLVMALRRAPETKTAMHNATVGTQLKAILARAA
eukprot:TRINITY_DN1812_c0_g1_i2.p2 TRINITY_DN1812_c0_g1~~TRINITY_DN1812_c0_g1_i2.p2  ORF type:complete len:447 (+),score=85.03 TRINITY_DN1812_c0_g1_i2:120-1460(+)